MMKLDSVPNLVNREVPVMPQAMQPQDEPDWVKRLREDGFDVRGGVGNLPEEPEASFAPMPGWRCECGGEYGEGTESRSLRIHGHEVAVEARLLRCGQCGRAIWAPGQADELRRKAWNAIRDREGLLYPEEILELRTSLGLSLDSFERLLGVGKKTVTRWEDGVIFPSAAANNLMKLLRLEPRNVAALAKWNRITMDPAISETERTA
jgi:putative zinc finger/helix-turn-helix YgiT family protein